MTDPTPRQLEVLRYIAHYSLTGSRSPTWREIGAALGLSSTNAVSNHLHAMDKKGLLTLPVQGRRSIALTDAGWEAAVGAGGLALLRDREEAQERLWDIELKLAEIIIPATSSADS